MWGLQWSVEKMHSFLFLIIICLFLAVRGLRAARAFLVAQLVSNLPAMQETLFRFLGWEDPLEKGSGNPLQDSFLKNPMDRGAWRATLHGVTRVGHDLATIPSTPASGGYSLLQCTGFHCHGSPCCRAQL